MIRTSLRLVAAVSAALHAGVALAQEAAPARAFAAPEAAASLPSGTAGGIGQATFALLIVLAVIFGIAWLARRLRNVAGSGGQGIEVLAQAAVGPRERVVVVRVANTRLLLGVAPGRVSALHELPADATLETPAHQGTPNLVESFRSLMNKGRK